MCEIAIENNKMQNYCCPHWESVWYATLLVLNNTTFINGRSVFQISRVIMWTGMICNFPLDVSKMIFFLVLKAPPIFPVDVHVVPQTIGIMNFVHNICLRIQQRSKIWGLELLLQGDQWLTYQNKVICFGECLSKALSCLWCKEEKQKSNVLYKFLVPLWCYSILE